MLFFSRFVYSQFVWCRTEGKIRIPFDNPVGLPFVGDEQNDTLFMIFDNHGTVDVFQFLIVVTVGLNPAGYGVWQGIHFQIDAVFVLQPVFQDFKLQLSNSSDDIAFHGTEIFVNLYSPFLSQLGHAFQELFALHRVFGTDPGEQFRRECREVSEGDLLFS